jgi:hypothetical protein
VYLFQNLGDLKDRFAAQEYSAAIDPALIPQICDNDGENCRPDPEAILDVLVANMFNVGTIWGEIVANMFQNSIEGGA